ncbi:MAG TPA: PAS domain S-box protein [Pyrinomonadaceae bacterium]|nr:PAS domain S-box protein [Pyrinomonadaceae bacterium]
MPRVHYSNNGRHEDTVLIVNDIPEQLSLMNRLLSKAGYDVITAGDGQEAFEVAKGTRPDVVISDVSMPRVNGIEFCRLIRQDADLRSTPILLVSAHRRDTESVLEGFESGADDYLELPFDSTRLIAKVSRLVERSRQEANYRDLVEHASDIIFTLDFEERLTGINTAGAKFLGFRAEEVIGVPFSEAFKTDPVDPLRTIGQTQLEIRDNLHVRTRDYQGQERWLEILTSPTKNREGETIGLRGVARDITDRKQVEIALRESDERYRLLFESTPQPIFVYDEQTLKFLAVNEAAIHTYGYDREEFLSMTIDDIRSREDTPALLIKTPTGIDEPLISSPWRHRRKDKSIIYVEMSSHRLDFNGSNARLVIANDVSERKLLDEKQLSLHASLQQAAMEWRQTFNAIDFPVLIVDLEGHIRRLNQAAEEIAGLPSEEILGRNVTELEHSEPWKKASELIKAIRLNGGSSSVEVKDETTGKTWAITLYLIHEFGSVGDRAILIAQDITKRAQLEASLRQGERMSLLGSLVAGVAHEVRNPLFGISSILDAFETRFSDRTEYLRYTDVLRDEVGRLTVLMEELLEYGKPFKGDYFKLSIEEVITKSLRACLPAAEVAQVTLENHISEPLPKLMVDRRRLSKVFVNLIENAIQHSPPGAIVSVEAREVHEPQQQWIDCSVNDCGPGILDEDKSKTFEPFFSKRRGGTGLGLAIADRIMGEHGGKLIAGNNARGGACMTARFPMPHQEEIVDG